MTQPFAIVGAGGFGREVVDVVEAMNVATSRPTFEILGVIDDRPSRENLGRLSDRGIDHLGTVADFLASESVVHYSIGVGSPGMRRELAERLDAAGHTAATLIHPTATTGARVAIAEGSVICAGVRMTTNIVIGRHVHMNLNATVGHDCVIKDFFSINPLASISGDCILEGGVMIGVGAVVLQGLTVGWNAVLGGSACAVKDAAANAVVKGVPAR